MNPTILIKAKKAANFPTNIGHKSISVLFDLSSTDTSFPPESDRVIKQLLNHQFVQIGDLTCTSGLHLRITPSVPIN